MFASLSDKLRAQSSWRKLDEAVAWMRPHCLTEIEQDEEHCLEAMLHWHSPGRTIQDASLSAPRPG